MYIYIVVLFMGFLPLASIAIEALAAHGGTDVLSLVGKWFVFWSVGIRLFTAGLRQAIQPEFTARKIFELGDDAPLFLVQELGFANIAIGLVGLVSIARVGWVMPAAL